MPKPLKIAFIVLVLGGLIHVVSQGQSVHVLSALPLGSGPHSAGYYLAAVLLLVMTGLALWALHRRR